MSRCWRCSWRCCPQRADQQYCRSHMTITCSLSCIERLASTCVRDRFACNGKPVVSEHTIHEKDAKQSPVTKMCTYVKGAVWSPTRFPGSYSNKTGEPSPGTCQTSGLRLVIKYHPYSMSVSQVTCGWCWPHCPLSAAFAPVAAAAALTSSAPAQNPSQQAPAGFSQKASELCACKVVLICFIM